MYGYSPAMTTKMCSVIPDKLDENVLCYEFAYLNTFLKLEYCAILPARSRFAKRSVSRTEASAKAGRNPLID